MEKALSVSKNQRGAVLVVAMVLLLVMSLIGLSSVVSSTLQEKMAGNAQQRSLARYAAETALKAAENYIASNIKSTSNLIKFNGGSKGLYAAYPVTALLPFDDLVRRESKLDDVSIPSQWTINNSVEVNLLSAKVQSVNSRYVIEYAGVRTESPMNITSPSGPVEKTRAHLFKITAIGWARDTNVYSVLQSHFMTGQGPGEFDYED